jgi:hypothetical protein
MISAAKLAWLQQTGRRSLIGTAKSDLSLRPIWHHKQGRVQAHIFVCFRPTCSQRRSSSGTSAPASATVHARSCSSCGTSRASTSCGRSQTKLRAGRTGERRGPPCGARRRNGRQFATGKKTDTRSRDHSARSGREGSHSLESSDPHPIGQARSQAASARAAPRPRAGAGPRGPSGHGLRVSSASSSTLPLRCRSEKHRLARDPPTSPSPASWRAHARSAIARVHGLPEIKLSEGKCHLEQYTGSRISCPSSPPWGARDASAGAGSGGSESDAVARWARPVAVLPDPGIRDLPKVGPRCLGEEPGPARWPQRAPTAILPS